MIPFSDINAIRSGRSRRDGAFSLIEVVIAVGMVSFAVITTIGLMPVGLGALHRAMDSTEEGQIVREIGAQVFLTPYSQLATNFSGATFYYDQDGVLLTNSPAARPSGTRYWVATTVTTPVFPGSSGATGLMNSLSTVHIQFMAGATTNATSSNSYNLQVPNSGN